MSRPIFKKELSVVQKMFNQRLLAAHAWTEAQAHHIYTQELLPAVSNDNDDDDAVDRVSLTETIQCCNGHLSDFGLEIVSITLPDYTKLQMNDHDDDDEEEEAQDDEEEEGDTEDRPPSNSKSSRRSSTTTTRNSSSTTPATTSTTIKYYTIINQFPDAIAKEIYQPFLFQPNGTLQGYVQHVVWHLSQQYPTPAARATILNLKNSIPHRRRSTTNPMEVAVVETMVPPSSTAPSSVVLPSPKVTLSQAEDMLERLLDEQWLMEVVVLSATKNRRTSSSSHNAKIALGPRTLGELSYLLQSSSSAAEDDDDNEPDNNVNDRQPPRSSSSSKWNVLLPQPIYIRY